MPHTCQPNQTRRQRQQAELAAITEKDRCHCLNPSGCRRCKTDIHFESVWREHGYRSRETAYYRSQSVPIRVSPLTEFVGL